MAHVMGSVDGAIFLSCFLRGVVNGLSDRGYGCFARSSEIIALFERDAERVIVYVHLTALGQFRSAFILSTSPHSITISSCPGTTIF